MQYIDKLYTALDSFGHWSILGNGINHYIFFLFLLIYIYFIVSEFLRLRRNKNNLSFDIMIKFYLLLLFFIPLIFAFLGSFVRPIFVTKYLSPLIIIIYPILFLALKFISKDKLLYLVVIIFLIASLFTYVNLHDIYYYESWDDLFLSLDETF